MGILKKLCLTAIIATAIASPTAISGRKSIERINDIGYQYQTKAIENVTDSWLEKIRYFENLEKLENQRATKISENGINLIKQYEGFSPRVYNDAGHRAIGYGHRIRPHENYNTITREQATELLKEHTEWTDAVISRNIQVHLNQNQYDAISSLIYNIGGGAFSRSDIQKKLNQGNYLEAAEEFKKWIYSRGKILPGLVSRRNAEYDLFMSDM